MLRQILNDAARSRKIYLDYFVYTATWNTLAAGATTAVTVPVQADSDFVLEEFNLVAFSAAGVLVPTPDYLIQLVDQGSGRALQDNPIHVSNVTGNGPLPYVLREPKFFIGNGSIQITLTNLTAVAARVDAALIGEKVFYLEGYKRNQLLGGL